MQRENVEAIMGWASTQGHIVTGGGKLNDRLKPGVHYDDPQDLPHYHKLQNTSWSAYTRWKALGYTQQLVVGVWCRPVFVGGWRESGSFDTQVFNLQTPTLFVDLRFPRLRPAKWLASFGSLQGIAAGGGDFEQRKIALRALARQHCFAGYTLVRPDKGSKDIAFRHHAIDWNFHPNFPRPRPNMWRIEVNEEGNSFKEWCGAVDEFGQALYMERWELLPQGGPAQGYLGMVQREVDSDRIKAVLVVIGRHFALAIDRGEPLPDFSYSSSGGCAALVDAACEQGALDQAASMLQMQGSYGRIVGGSAQGRDVSLRWQILFSTHPWLEGETLREIEGDAEMEVESSSEKVLRIRLKGVWWDVLECSFSAEQLLPLFPGTVKVKRNLIRSRI